MKNKQPTHPPVINGLSFDIEDWFQVENLREVCPIERWDDFELRVEKNVDRILAILDQAQVYATFFILGWIAQRKPQLVKNIAKHGHEIASHGFNHQIVYKLTPDLFYEDLNRSKKLLEDITGRMIAGYRAPNFSITKDSIWAIDILKELGFEYVSSIFPTSFHDRYGFVGVNANEVFQFENGLRELTLGIYELGKVNVPCGGGAYFRLIPYRLFRAMLRQINQKGSHFIFYLHPWELDYEQPRVKISKSLYFRHYINLAKTESKLQRLLEDFKFQPLDQLCQEISIDDLPVRHLKSGGN